MTSFLNIFIICQSKFAETSHDFKSSEHYYFTSCVHQATLSYDDDRDKIHTIKINNDLQMRIRRYCSSISFIYFMEKNKLIPVPGNMVLQNVTERRITPPYEGRYYMLNRDTRLMDDAVILEMERPKNVHYIKVQKDLETDL